MKNRKLKRCVKTVMCLLHNKTTSFEFERSSQRMWTCRFMTCLLIRSLNLSEHDAKATVIHVLLHVWCILELLFYILMACTMLCFIECFNDSLPCCWNWHMRCNFQLTRCTLTTYYNAICCTNTFILHFQLDQLCPHQAVVC